MAREQLEAFLDERELHGEVTQVKFCWFNDELLDRLYEKMKTSTHESVEFSPLTAPGRLVNNYYYGSDYFATEQELQARTIAAV